jgi:hypothetical protein
MPGHLMAATDRFAANGADRFLPRQLRRVALAWSTESPIGGPSTVSKRFALCKGRPPRGPCIVLSPRKHLLVVNMYEELRSLRAVAEIVGGDHKAVKAHVLRNAERRPPERGSIADPFRDVIRSKLQSTSGKITAKTLFRTLKAAGYEVSARTLRRVVASDRASELSGGERSRIGCTGRGTRAPGDVLIADWGHVGAVPTAGGRASRTASAPCSAGAGSRFVRFKTSQTFATLAGCLAACFEHLGGDGRCQSIRSLRVPLLGS